MGKGGADHTTSQDLEAIRTIAIGSAYFSKQSSHDGFDGTSLVNPVRVSLALWGVYQGLKRITPDTGNLSHNSQKVAADSLSSGTISQEKNTAPLTP